jgi:hypothetical protein
MRTKLTTKLIIILAVLIVVAVIGFIWIRQQPVKLDTGTETCEIKV